jgi:hypothetical protein
MCKTSCQSDPFTVSLGDNVTRSVERPHPGPLMPHPLGKQTEGSPSQFLILANSPNRCPHGISHGVGSHPVPLALVGECSIPVV